VNWVEGVPQVATQDEVAPVTQRYVMHGGTLHCCVCAAQVLVTSPRPAVVWQKVDATWVPTPEPTTPLYRMHVAPATWVPG